MSKHTPGPWVIDSEDADLFTQNQARMWINATGMHIGFVDGPRTSERIANARLIAAAPEMYELLQNIRAVMPRTACSGCTVDSYAEDIDALLAKIEGGGNNG